MSATSQVTVTSVSPTPITVLSACKHVRIMENRGVAGWPTSDFLISRSGPNGTYVRIPAGNSYTFEQGQAPSFGYFSANQVVGYIKTVSGSTTFDQDEDNAG